MIVGLGMASEIARKEMSAESQRLLHLRNRLHTGITSKLEDVYLNGHPELRLPGNLNLSFAFVEGEGLMMGIKDIAVSSGSACTSASLEPSYVLKALGLGDELAHSSIRFGLGRFTTEEEIDKKVAIGDRRRRQSSKEGQRSRPEGHTESRGLRHRNSAWGDAPKILSRMPGVPVGEYSADTQQRLAVDVADRRAKPMKQYGHKRTSCAFVHRGANRRPGGESFRVFVFWGVLYCLKRSFG